MQIGLLLQGHRVTEWVADAIGLPQYVPVFKDNLITVSTLMQFHYLLCFTQRRSRQLVGHTGLASEATDGQTGFSVQVLDFPLFVNDGGASLKHDLGVRPGDPLCSRSALPATLI